MTSENLTKEVFLEDIKNHKVQIVKDDGLYRHLICSSGSFNQRFEIVTFPNYLVCAGDMGDFVFTRIDDMFQFFRGKDINTYYWAEKCVAESVYGNGIREFSSKLFHEAVLEHTRLYLDLDENDEIPEDIMDEIYVLLHCDNEYECVSAMNDFSSDKIEFTDFWENTVREKTYHFVWCCYALVWAINEYDKIKGE